MAVSLICPSCNAASDFNFKSLPIVSCPKCGSPFPDSLRISAEESLTRQKPLLIRIGTFFAVFVAAMAMITILMILVVGDEDIRYTMDGPQVTREYFLSRIFPVAILYAGTLLAIAYGFWRERPWARHLVVVYSLVASLAGVVEFWWMWRVFPKADVPGFVLALFLTFQVLMLGMAVGIVVWYFYFKPNVVAYYGALSKRE